MTPERKEKLRMAVRFFYDLQKLRIQTGNRSGSNTAELEDADQQFLSKTSDGLEALEKGALKEVSRLLKGIPIYEQFLKNQKGCGPTMAGVIVAEIEIDRAPSPSSLWAYAGLSVDQATGEAVRRKRGVKSNWNPFLKTKLVGVLADCMLRANSPWRKFYDDYKHRMQTDTGPCTACEDGKIQKLGADGKVVKKDGAAVMVQCKNCDGTCLGPRGKSDGHRHNRAKRYMVKMFLLELYNEWRTLEGLPIRVPYAEEYQGRKHHAA